MFCSKRLSDGKTVIAWETLKREGPFICPDCGAPMVLAKGEKVIHYFRHKASTTCSYGSGETEEHRFAKKYLYDYLSSHPKIRKVAMEYKVGDQRPDILTIMDNKPVAIEIQRSDLTEDEVKRRTLLYHTKGIYVLWIVLLPEKAFEEEHFVPKPWQKWLQATYYGKVFHFEAKNGKIYPIRFEAASRYIEETSFYNSEGEQLFFGGYEKFYVKKREVIRYDPVDLVEDFYPQYKRSWKYYPACSILSLKRGALRGDAIGYLEGLRESRKSLTEVYAEEIKNLYYKSGASDKFY